MQQSSVLHSLARASLFVLFGTFLVAFNFSINGFDILSDWLGYFFLIGGAGLILKNRNALGSLYKISAFLLVFSILLSGIFHLGFAKETNMVDSIMVVSLAVVFFGIAETFSLKSLRNWKFLLSFFSFVILALSAIETHFQGQFPLNLASLENIGILIVVLIGIIIVVYFYMSLWESRQQLLKMIGSKSEMHRSLKIGIILFMLIVFGLDFFGHTYVREALAARLCGNAAETKTQGECYVALVQMYPKEKYCLPLGDSSYKDQCYQWLAQLNNEASFCGEIGNNSLSKNPSKDACYSIVGQVGKNPEICKNIADIYLREGCLVNVALNAKNPSVCESIKDKTRKQTCLKNIDNIGL